MTDTYKKAYTEVLEIIKYLPDEECSKIPISEINFYEENKDKNYNFKINPEIDLADQNISREANAILVLLFKEYFASEKQKKVLDNLLEQNQQKQEEAKYEKYNPNDIFKNKKNNLNTEIEKEKYENFYDRKRINENAKSLNNEGVSKENIKNNYDNNNILESNMQIMEYRRQKWYQKIFAKIREIFSKN